MDAASRSLNWSRGGEIARSIASTATYSLVMTVEQQQAILDTIQIQAFGTCIKAFVYSVGDVRALSLAFVAPCSDTGETKDFSSREYLARAEDELQELSRTVLVAFRNLMDHEAHEGVTISGSKVFSPHKQI